MCGLAWEPPLEALELAWLDDTVDEECDDEVEVEA